MGMRILEDFFPLVKLILPPFCLLTEELQMGGKFVRVLDARALGGIFCWPSLVIFSASKKRKPQY